MTETQRRIKELKRSLPNMKEKVVAVAVLLALSLTMMASVSYAWYTLSFAPELGGVNTTVAANGNLEIALSDFDGLEPDSSGITDSFAAEGQSVHGANTSWGNLVNISSGYGLDNLVLRPAKFDPQSLTFLSSMLYGDDGRADSETSSFAFTTWQYDEDWKKYQFSVPIGNAYGVRAISSVSAKGLQAELQEMLSEADGVRQAAADEYQKIMTSTEYMTAIQAVVQIYLNYNMYDILNRNNLGFMASGRDNSDITKYVPALQGVFNDFYDKAILKLGDAIADVANIQRMLIGNTGKTITRDDLTNGASLPSGLKLGQTLVVYRRLEKQVREDRDLLNQYVTDNAGKTIYLNPAQNGGDSTLLDIVNRLININNVLVDGTKVSTLMGSGTTAMGYINGLNNGDTVEVVITKGSIYDFEAATGERMDVTMRNLDMILKTVHGHLTTNAEGSLFSNLISVSKNMDSNYAASLTADDTYGMVLDLWFRTNAAGEEGVGTVLTLDGLPQIETEYVRRMIVPSGEKDAVPVSYYMRDTSVVLAGERMKEEVLVFKKGADLNGDGTIEDGEYIYYSCNSYEPVYRTTITKDEKGNEVVVDTDVYITDVDVSPKNDKVEKVVGFESANRIWKDGELSLDSDEISASQGSGSCYVFYADTPAKAESALELLSHMKLAFIDESGVMTAQAIMDVEHVFAQSGKYVVPLTIVSSEHVTTDEAGNEIYGVTSLKQNVAARISVVVYLEGEGLENSMVMSKDAIAGSLNLQFTTTENLRSVKDTAVSMDTISLRADINGGNELSFNYDSDAVYEPVLTAYVEGLTPTEVEAVFVRRINATQGKQMTPISLIHQSGDVWTATCSFTRPGTYELKSLIVDGVEYPFQELVALDDDGLKDDYIRVTVTGFAVESVSFCETKGSNVALTTDNRVTRDVTVSFHGDLASQPGRVSAYFTTTDGIPVTAKLTRTGDYWTGTATFSSSGTYVLQYLILDDDAVEDKEDIENPDFYELPMDLQKSFIAYLGLRTQIEIQPEAELSFDYEGLKTFTVKADILTDTGEKLKGFEDVVLRYKKRNGTLEGGLKAPMEWRDGQYCGVFNVDEIGVFNFAQLEVGKTEDGVANIITSAITAPTITARSTKPPVYLGSDTQNFFIVGDSDPAAQYSAKISYADGAEDIFAVFTNSAITENGELVEFAMPMLVNAVAEETNDGYTVYNFNLPTNPAKDVNSQTGVWTLKEIRVYGVYDEAGNYYGYGDPSTEEDDTYYVPRTNVPDDYVTPEVYTVIDGIAVTADKATLGKNEAGVITAEFLSSQTLPSGFGVTVTVPGYAQGTGYIDSVELNLLHRVDSTFTYGSYTYTDMPAANETITIGLVRSGDKWVVPANTTVQLAGRYDYTLTVTMKNGDKTYTYRAGSVITDNKNQYVETDDVLVVYSARPTVTVTGTSHPEVSGSEVRVYTVKEPNAREQLIQGEFFKNTSYSAAVYIYTPLAGSGSYDQEAAMAYVPYVSMGLGGVPSGYASATMTFVTKNADSVGTTFSFNSDFAATASIGSVENGERGNTGVKRYPVIHNAGEMKQNKVSVTYGSITYEVTVSNEITIDNPLSPTAIMFTKIPGTVPEDEVPTVVLGDGTTVSMRLPSIYWTAYTEKADDDVVWSEYVPSDTGSHLVYTATPRTETVKDDCGNNQTQRWLDYQYYVWTLFESTGTGWITYYKQDFKIISWKLTYTYNGETIVRTYNSGDDINITADGTIVSEAIVTPVDTSPKVDTDKPRQKTTATRKLYGYVKEESLDQCLWVEVEGWTSGNYYLDGYEWGESPYTTRANSTKQNAAPALCDISQIDITKDLNEQNYASANFSDSPNGYTDFLAK